MLNDTQTWQRWDPMKQCVQLKPNLMEMGSVLLPAQDKVDWVLQQAQEHIKWWCAVGVIMSSGGGVSSHPAPITCLYNWF